MLNKRLLITTSKLSKSLINHKNKFRLTQRPPRTIVTPFTKPKHMIFDLNDEVIKRQKLLEQKNKEKMEEVRNLILSFRSKETIGVKEDDEDDEDCSGNSFRILFKKYGKYFVGIYVLYNVSALAVLYLCISSLGYDLDEVVEFLEDHHDTPGVKKMIEKIQHHPTFVNFFLAYFLNNFVEPIRILAVISSIRLCERKGWISNNIIPAVSNSAKPLTRAFIPYMLLAPLATSIFPETKEKFI